MPTETLITHAKLSDIIDVAVHQGRKIEAIKEARECGIESTPTEGILVFGINLAYEGLPPGKGLKEAKDAVEGLIAQYEERQPEWIRRACTERNLYLKELRDERNNNYDARQSLREEYEGRLARAQETAEKERRVAREQRDKALRFQDLVWELQRNLSDTRDESDLLRKAAARLLVERETLGETIQNLEKEVRSLRERLADNEMPHSRYEED